VTEERYAMLGATVSAAIVPTQCVITACTLLIPRGIMRVMRGSPETEPSSVAFSRATAVAARARYAHALFNSTSQNAVQTNSYGINNGPKRAYQQR
jgi:hypothetical protein